MKKRLSEKIVIGVVNDRLLRNAKNPTPGAMLRLYIRYCKLRKA
jgi:hypothetical protein